MAEQNRRSDHVKRETSADIVLPEPVLQRLGAYRQLVEDWSSRLDLVAPGDVARLWPRHIADSLKALPLLQSAEPGDAIDAGSGAGLPGIPLALADESRAWRLLEPRKKRAAFLEEVARSLALDVEILPLTAQEAAKEERLTQHAVATARALATPPEAVELLLSLLRTGGTAILWVGSATKLPPNSVLSSEGLATIQKG